MKLNKLDLAIIIPFVVILTILGSYKFMYIPFAIITIKNIFMVYRGHISIEIFLLLSIIYSIALSDNFIVIGFTGLLFLYYTVLIIRGKRKFCFKNKINPIIYIAIVIFFIINITTNNFHKENFILFIIYNFCFIAAPLIFAFIDRDIFKSIDKSLNTLIVTEAIAVFLFFIIKFNVVLANLFGDWSIGTLGTSEGVQLFNIFIFGGIKAFSYFNEYKDKKYLIIFILCVGFALSTVTVANTMIFFCILGIFTVFFISSPKIKFIFLGIIIVLCAFFWETSHPWIKEQVRQTIFDSEFRNNRIKKFKTYEDTFVRLPQKDFKVGLIGNGAGNYSSRAALTVSGYYTKWYTKERFDTNVNKYAKKFIRPRIYDRVGLSIVDQPTSQIISIMGEFGYIGIALFLLVFLYMMIKSTRTNKLTLMYFFAILFLDNYFEYPKIAMVFWITYYLIENIETEIKKN